MAIKKYIPLKKQIVDHRSPDGGYYEAECEVCGTVFYPKRSTAKYCSESCGQVAFRKNHQTKANKKVKKTILPIVKPKRSKKTAPKAEKLITNPYTTHYAYKRTLEQWDVVFKMWVSKGKCSNEEANEYYGRLHDLNNGESALIGDIMVAKDHDKFHNN